MDRAETISQLADLISALCLDHPVRVGIDGVDCAGKTALADELVGPIRARGRSVIRASIDGFHQPREIRYRQGRTSPTGYYEDSFDLRGVLSCVLLPLGPDGDRRFRPIQFDLKHSVPVLSNWQIAAADAVLLFDGVFLHRPELLTGWDFTVFVDASFDATLSRALMRDQQPNQTPDEIQKLYTKRYIPAQVSYLAAHRPRDLANVVLINDHIEKPELVVLRSGPRTV